MKTHEKMSKCLIYAKDCLENGFVGEVVVMEQLLINQIKEICAELTRLAIEDTDTQVQFHPLTKIAHQGIRRSNSLKQRVKVPGSRKIWKTRR